jgi:hypothetical protein
MNSCWDREVAADAVSSRRKRGNKSVNRIVDPTRVSI